jgi:hypothetical protein
MITNAKYYVLALTSSLMLGYSAIVLADNETDDDDIDNDERVELTIIDSPSVTRIVGGINPDYFAYRISGAIFKASNKCLADDVDVDLKTHVDGSTLYVTPLRIVSDESQRQCHAAHAPVYEYSDIDVRHSRGSITKIIVRNVGKERGNLVINP